MRNLNKDMEIIKKRKKRNTELKKYISEMKIQCISFKPVESTE